MVVEKCVFCKAESNCKKIPGPGVVWKVDCRDCGRYEITFDVVMDYASHDFDLKKVRDWIKANSNILITTKNVHALL